MVIAEVDTAAPDASLKYENSLLPIPGRDRSASSMTMIWLWAGGNILLTTFVLGGYYAAAIGAAAMIIVTIVGALLGNLFPSISGLRSARYGVDEYIGLRATYGTYGSYIGVLLLVLVNFGWVGILAGIAGTAGADVARTYNNHQSIPHMYTVFALGIGLVLPVALLYIRPQSIFRLVRFAVPLLIVFAGLLLWRESTVFGWRVLSAIKPTHAVNWQYALEAQIAYGVSWFPYMGAWNRFAKSERGAFVGAWLGMGFIAILFAIVGGFATLAVGSSTPSAWATKTGLGVPALFIIILSTVINLAMLLYCSAMALRTALPKLSYRFVVVAVSIPSIAFIYEGTLADKFSILLTIAGGIIAPYWGVAIGDYFLRRRQHLDLVALYEGRGGRYWYKGGFNPAAVGVWIAGVIFWMFLGGWETPYSWLAFGPGEHTFNLLTATAPTIVGTALVYWAIATVVVRRAVRANASSPIVSGMAADGELDGAAPDLGSQVTQPA